MIFGRFFVCVAVWGQVSPVFAFGLWGRVGWSSERTFALGKVFCKAVVCGLSGFGRVHFLVAAVDLWGGRGGTLGLVNLAGILWLDGPL